MLTILIALRDALIVMALSWIGVTVERRVEEHPAAPAEVVACSVDGGVCKAEKPSFNALGCRDD